MQYLRKAQFARFLREKIEIFKNFHKSPHSLLLKELKILDVDVVIDGGANVGQFGLDLYRHGYEGLIYSYEPVQQCFLSLQQTAKKYRTWTAMQLGLGAANSNAFINISGNSGLSSSILEMSHRHISNFPKSATVRREAIHLIRLDEEIKRLKLDPTKIALKLDVQGFEYQALIGAGHFLRQIPVCFIELSIRPLYQEEQDFLKVLNFLSNSGHVVVEVFRGVTGKNGELLQIDVITTSKAGF